MTLCNGCMTKIIKLSLEGATHEFRDQGKLRFDNLKTAKYMILMSYITKAQRQYLGYLEPYM